MDLFNPIVNTDKFHPNFKSLLDNLWKKEREVIQSWSDGFPDRDGKFVKEFQTTFNSSFWELYLYKLFCNFDLGFDWKHSTPDFSLKHNNSSFIVEATSANKGKDERPHEWEAFKKSVSHEPNNHDMYIKNLKEIHKYSIIRLSNGISSKLRKYRDSYSHLKHVKQKPFVIAIAPYEQPFFYYQYDRAIVALLFKYYVDDNAFYKNPERFPDGPPIIDLDSVEKDNGSEIELGIFKDDRAKEISAIIFNASATVGKSKIDLVDKFMKSSNNWFLPDGTYEAVKNEQEILEDGLFVFHNPFASTPLDFSIFEKDRVCQVTVDIKTGIITKHIGEKHLESRNSMLGRF